MVNEKVRYWTELSEYDLDTAEAMLDTKRFLYVAFMCHQCVEKAMKAYYQWAKDEMPPKTRILKSLTYEKCSEMLRNVRGLHTWIKSKLSEKQESMSD